MLPQKSGKVKANDKKWSQQYTRSIFIFFAACNPETNVMDFPTYFAQEFGITDNRNYCKKMARQGLLKLTKDDTVVVTKPGMAAIDDEDVAFFQLACPYVTIGDYRRQKEDMDKVPFERVMVKLLIKKGQELFANREFQKAADLGLEVAALYEKLYAYEDAAMYYIRALYCDLRGGDKYKSILTAVETGRRKRLEAINQFDSIYIRPQIIAGLQRRKDCALDKYATNAVSRKRLHYAFCKPERFPQLVNEIAEGAYQEANWREHYLQRYRFKVQIAWKQYQKNHNKQENNQ